MRDLEQFRIEDGCSKPQLHPNMLLMSFLERQVAIQIHFKWLASAITVSAVLFQRQNCRLQPLLISRRSHFPKADKQEATSFSLLGPTRSYSTWCPSTMSFCPQLVKLFQGSPICSERVMTQNQCNQSLQNMETVLPPAASPPRHWQQWLVATKPLWNSFILD